MVKLPGIQSMCIYKVLIMIILISNFTFSDFLAIFLYDFLIIFFKSIYFFYLRNKDEKDSTAVELCEYNLVIFSPHWIRWESLTFLCLGDQLNYSQVTNMHIIMTFSF